MSQETNAYGAIPQRHWILYQLLMIPDFIGILFCYFEQQFLNITTT